MSRNVKEIIEYCRGGTKEEMCLSDFKTYIDAIYFHIGQAMKYEDDSRLSKNHLRIVDNVCAATSNCFLDECDNLVIGSKARNVPLFIRSQISKNENKGSRRI